ncbi:minor capsid protein [Streptococcus sp. NLN76]|uniref:minor capsid protein n=1 Tax=Streptococcus sp. NLN76 TaxID=2822800 RepID=UPI0018AC22FD|nr:minor capsid protein [Streptococcus sp. NLN76]MBF8970168.1 minor capsid protein [Streptococcus sp. NLN76]
MSRSVDYWKERAKKEEALSRKRDRDVSKELDDLYKLYIKEIEKQIYSMEKRFSEKKDLTIVELKKLTDQYDVQAFNAKAAKYVKERNFTDEANRELSWYNFTMRLNRLEAIKAELSLEMLALASEETKITGNFLDAEYLYRLKSQANILGISIPTDLTLRSKTRAIVDSNFEGAVWSERIWGRQEKLRDLVVKTVGDLLILGKNPTTAIPEIRRVFDVSVFEAKRLAVTEGARVAMATQKNIMKANGFEYYIYLPETSACKICKPLDEKVFRIDDMRSGKNAPPMHPFCKCTIASYYSGSDKAMSANNSDKWPDADRNNIIGKDDRNELTDFASQMGIKIQGLKRFDGDVDLLREFIAGAGEVLSLFSNLKFEDRRPLTLSLTNMADTDFAITKGHIIELNRAIFRDKSLLEERYRILMDEGWFAEGTGYQSIIHHEMGHVIADKIGLDNISVAETITGLAKGDLFDYINQNLSIYAGSFSDGGEIPSEALSSFMGTSPSQFAVQFVREMLKYI